MRRVLIISYAFPPLRVAEAPQAWRMAAGLAGHGWTPTVVTVAPSTSRDPSDTAEPESTFDIVRVPSREPRWLISLCWRACRSMLAVPDEKRLWVGRAAAAAARLIHAQRFDVVLTRSCPLSAHLVGLALKRRFGAPWVAHFSDPWTASPYFPRHTAWQVRCNRRLERRVVRAADRLTFTNVHARDAVLDPYGDEARAKAAIVPHATDLSLRRAAQAPPAEPGPLRLLHAGSLYGPRTARALYEAMAQIEKEDSGAARLTLLGPMAPEERAVRDAVAPAHAVATRAPVAADAALAQMSQADVLVSIDAMTDAASPFLPSKLYDYLIAERPILALAPRRGATADFMAAAPGVCVSPDDADGVAAALRDMIARKRSGQAPAPLPSERFVQEQDVGPASARLAAVLEDAAGAQESRSGRSDHESPLRKDQSVD